MDEVSIECEENHGLVLVYSLLSRTKVRIAMNGRHGFVKSFVGLLKAISFGSSHSIEGDFMRFVPGSLRGGEVTVGCECEVSMYILPLLLLCPFVQEPLKIKFKGVTNGELCVDVIRIVHFNVMRRFGIDKCELVVKRRGFGPLGRGEVVFTTQGPQRIGTIDLADSEKLTKIRGLVVSSRVSTIPTREMTERIKELMSDICNTKVFSNVCNKGDSGPSPGFQCAVFAESKNGVYYSTQNGEDLTPVETASIACKNLLKSIRQGGVFDRKVVYIALTFMALASTSVGRLGICKIDVDVQRILDLLKTFFGFEYDVRRQESSYVISGLGCGLTAMNRVLR